MTTRASIVLLCASHLLGNALLLWLGYHWLGMGEADAVQLAFSAAAILFFALAAVWLHGMSLAFFRREGLMLLHSAVRAFKHLPPLFLLSVVILLLYLALQHVSYNFGHEAFTIGSYTTMTLRRPVAPEKVLKAFHFFIWLLRWFIIPILALPLASEIAALGWSGFHRAAFQRSRKVVFWLETGLLLITAIHLPLRLFFWIPKMSSFSLEAVSVTARAGLGYLLFTFGLLALEFVTSSGRPRSTQPSTAASP